MLLLNAVVLCFQISWTMPVEPYQCAPMNILECAVLYLPPSDSLPFQTPQELRENYELRVEIRRFHFSDWFLAINFDSFQDLEPPNSQQGISFLIEFQMKFSDKVVVYMGNSSHIFSESRQLSRPMDAFLKEMIWSDHLIFKHKKRKYGK